MGVMDLMNGRHVPGHWCPSLGNESGRCRSLMAKAEAIRRALLRRPENEAPSGAEDRPPAVRPA
jgi:hypothetical protein